MDKPNKHGRGRYEVSNVHCPLKANPAGGGVRPVLIFGKMIPDDSSVDLSNQCGLMRVNFFMIFQRTSVIGPLNKTLIQKALQLLQPNCRILFPERQLLLEPRTIRSEMKQGHGHQVLLVLETEAIGILAQFFVDLHDRPADDFLFILPDL